MIIPTIGNNDGRFKDEAIDQADKEDYDSLIYDLWFNELPGNSSLDKISIKETIASGSYFRADVTSDISVLSLNSMYWDYKDKTNHDNLP